MSRFTTDVAGNALQFGKKINRSQFCNRFGYVGTNDNFFFIVDLVNAS